MKKSFGMMMRSLTISPVVLLRTRHKRKQQEQEDDKQKPDGFKTLRQDPHRFVGCEIVQISISRIVQMITRYVYNLALYMH